MEEREGKFVSYDGATKKATLTDTFSGGTILADDPGNVYDPGSPPIDKILSYVTLYIPARAGQTERIVNIIKSIKAT